MRQPRIREIVRNFPENGLKLLLEDPSNLRDVLMLDQYAHVGQLDFDHVKLDRTTYIQPDFRRIRAGTAAFRAAFRQHRPAA